MRTGADFRHGSGSARRRGTPVTRPGAGVEPLPIRPSKCHQRASAAGAAGQRRRAGQGSRQPSGSSYWSPAQMTLASGREFLSIPGPTTVPDEVLSAMHRPAIDIYSGALLEVTTSCLADLRRVFRTEGRVYIYAANGHGAWEAALVNVLSRRRRRAGAGERPVRRRVGRDGPRARARGRDPARRRAAAPSIPRRSRRACARTGTGRIKAVLVVQVDTASGVVNDIPAIREAIDAAGHDALLMVDAIASLATMPFEMDGWRVDVAVAGSQKGLMTPPGLSFVAAGPQGARRPPHAPGCARATGTGPSARASSTTRNTAARRRSTCCSACARRSTCCSRRASRTCSGAIACSPRRSAARLPSGRQAGSWLQHRGAFGARRFRDHRAHGRRAGSEFPPRVLRAAMRRRAGRRDRPAARQGVCASRTWATSTRR